MRIAVSLFLLTMAAICALFASELWKRDSPLFAGVALGTLGALCLLAVVYYRRLVCPGCARIPGPRRRCGRCGSSLPVGPRIFACGLLVLLAGLLYLLTAPGDAGSHPPSPKSAYQSGYANGFQYAFREDESSELGTLAWQRATEAVPSFHGKTWAAGMTTGFHNGRIAGLTSKPPHHLPPWVNANHPALQAKWFRLADEMKVVGGELKHVEALLKRTETLRASLEALATERPADDRELLDTGCDKLSAISGALTEFCSQLTEEARRASAK